jgi:hypothetical protein
LLLLLLLFFWKVSNAVRVFEATGRPITLARKKSVCIKGMT